ncbi:hypothetical protein MKX01_039732 [Papaver californicum]|nr:hypothetical protein MKX01_039732 [Papaver californicum]
MTTDPHYKAIDKKVLEKQEEFHIKPWELSVVWGKDKRYWSVPDPDDTTMDPHIELLQVSWLEVTGSIKLKDFVKTGKYSVSFRIGMKKDAFGWKREVWRSANIAHKDDSTSFEIPEGAPLQIEIPDLDDYNDDEKLHFGLYEVWQGRWKGGLQIYEAIIKPAETKIKIASN